MSFVWQLPQWIVSFLLLGASASGFYFHRKTRNTRKLHAWWALPISVVFAVIAWWLLFPAIQLQLPQLSTLLPAGFSLPVVMPCELALTLGLMGFVFICVRKMSPG